MRKIDTANLANRLARRFERAPIEYRSVWVTPQAWNFFRAEAKRQRKSVADVATLQITRWLIQEKSKRRAAHAKQRNKLGLTW